jgi:uncharacterized protein with HEPN domain
MWPNEQNDLVYLLNILEYIGKIWYYTEDIDDVETLYELNEQLNLNAALNLLSNIGETVSKISDGLKIEYVEIEWRQMKNFRNIIVHNYVGIDLAITYEVIKVDLKKIKTNLEKIIKEKINNKIFDIEELQIGKNSKFYKYIDWQEMDALLEG